MKIPEPKHTLSNTIDQWFEDNNNVKVDNCILTLECGYILSGE